MLHLVTGYQGTPHITSADQGAFNAGCVGLSDYVFSNGNRLEAQVVASNTVRILDGSLSMQGRHVNLESGTFIDVGIAEGLQSMNRNDLIVVRYTKDVISGIESVALVVLQGTASEGTAVDPSHTDGNILSGATLHEMPLYRVRMVGLNIESVEPIFNVLAPLSDIQHGFYKQNMLINGDFQCNQRGESTYDIGDTAAYTVDMWRAFQVNVDVLPDGVVLTGKSATTQGFFTQFIQLGKLETKTYTISAMVDGEICTFTLTPGGSAKEKSFGKFKISALTTSVWDNNLGDYNNKLKVNICPIGTNTFTVTYVDVFEGTTAYPHVKEDKATALMRCKRYIKCGGYVSPVVHYSVSGSYHMYQFAVCFEAMEHTQQTPPMLESCSWSYYDTNNVGVSGDVSKDSANNTAGLFLVRATSTSEMNSNSPAIRGVYVITCEPRDA